MGLKNIKKGIGSRRRGRREKRKGKRENALSMYSQEYANGIDGQAMFGAM